MLNWARQSLFRFRNLIHT